MDLEERHLILTDKLEDYKNIFFEKYEKSGVVSYIQYLHKEKQRFTKILKDQMEEESQMLQEQLFENGDTDKFNKMCKSKSQSVLEDFKKYIFMEKNVDESIIFSNSEEVLDQYGVGFFIFNEEKDQLLENENFDFLICYLENFLYTFYNAELDPSRNKIIQFIDSEIGKENINLLRFKQNDDSKQNEVSENDFSDTKAKEKLILLDKLGIVKFLIDHLEYKENATHLADIISSITGIDNKKGTLTGYCNYLIRPVNDNRNSPYFSENTVSKSMQIFNKFRLKD